MEGIGSQNRRLLLITLVQKTNELSSLFIRVCSKEISEKRLSGITEFCEGQECLLLQCLYTSDDMSDKGSLIGLSMDFEITEEQKAIQRTVREFAKKEISPKVMEYDREERFPLEIVKKTGELGFMGGVIPECCGGVGMDYLTHVLVVEELSRVCPIMGCISSLASGLVGSGILEYGNERQKRIYLTPLAKGERLGGVGITETHSGTDVAKMETRAYRDGEGYILRGSKTWISLAGVADWFITFATLDPLKGVKGICAFIVEVSSPGMSTRPIKDNLGMHLTPVTVTSCHLGGYDLP